MAELPAQRKSEGQPGNDPAGSLFGAELRRLRQARQMSLGDLSREIHYSPGFLSKIENGKAQPNPSLADDCDKLFNAGGGLAVLAAPRRRRSRSSLTDRPVDLPATNTVFLGREPQLAMITGFLTEKPDVTSIVVVYGMPGVGKTELVVRAASQILDRYTAGCLFLDLHSASHRVDTHAAMDYLLRRLGLPPELIPPEPNARTAYYRQVMRDRRILLILDNPATAADVAGLIAPGGAGDILVASGRRLDALDESYQVELRPLDQHDARILFEQIAGGRAGETAGLLPDTVDQITYACARLPLAVRIAAARLRASRFTSPAELLALLENERHRLSTLDDGERSVAGAFMAACAALSSPLRRLFALLSLHPGPSFGRRVVGILAEVTEDEADRLLDSLVGTCLIHRLSPDGHVQHNLVRSVAMRWATTILQPDQRAAATDRLINGYLLTAQHADVTITPGRYRRTSTLPTADAWYASFTGPADASAWFDAELENFVTVCELASDQDRPEACWRLAYAMRDFFFRTRRAEEWINTHTMALIAARRCDDRWAVAVTLNNLGLAYATAGQCDTADEYYGEALTLFRQLRDLYGEANSLGHLAWTAYLCGRQQTAAERATTALNLYERSGADRNAAITRRTLAVVEMARGNTEAATAHLRSALAAFITAGLTLDEAMTLNCLGDVGLQTNESGIAGDYYNRALIRARDGGSPFEQSRALRGLAAAARRTGRHRAAARIEEAAHGYGIE